MDVLVLDAEKKEREVLRDQLVKKGFTISESSGGFRMLEDLSQFKKDLVVLEYNTWRSNRGPYRYFGVERAWAGIPVILITSKDRTDVFNERHPHDKDVILEKPVDPEKFGEVLNQFAGE